VRMETKVRLMEALVFPVATYGAETCTKRKADIKKVEALEKNADDFIDRKRTNTSIHTNRATLSFDQPVQCTHDWVRGFLSGMSELKTELLVCIHAPPK